VPALAEVVRPEEVGRVVVGPVPVEGHVGGALCRPGSARRG
jgi:hypothetical protein